MLLDLGRVFSFLFSILSLYSVMHTAFFVTATTWRERLIASIAQIVIAACICAFSGVLFRVHSHPAVPLSRTLPVVLFLWTLTAFLILFPLAWCLDTYYIPQLWRNQPYVF
ncbi:MAG: hypothetical protein WBR26_14295 [Candidatus Acidiferrum sp.]